MRYLLLIFILILFVFVTCSDDNSSGVGEEITQPDIPAGPESTSGDGTYAKAAVDRALAGGIPFV